ncbi:DNA-binding response regulator [Gulosibacter molinativorax]|uniref:DNA-binding response regulator n=2 Tax=Gulosibacter molinativorax TaxID=256821 RepID=A0ABT7C9I8_9MICO|nr:DNA-binding response regulator [Gulosibacter molinativorax]QUY62522.1 Putative LuxR-family transcriptional regulator [Gulosibacter molinativorax]
MNNGVPPIGLFRRLADTLSEPLASVPASLSGVLTPMVSHTALVMLTADASGGRVQGFGDPQFTRDLQGLDLDALRRAATGVETVQRAPIRVGGTMWPTLQAIARNGALLILARPGACPSDGAVLDLWTIVSTLVQERADSATPDYLWQARAASGARLTAVSELEDEFRTLLERLLVTLRSRRLSDAEAREIAIARASAAIANLNRITNAARELTEVPVATAFARLKSDLSTILEQREIQVQFVDPPADGRPLPDEVARGARAVVLRCVLSLIVTPEIRRVLVQWDCDGTNLLAYVRTDGPGRKEDAAPLDATLERRVQALGARMSVDTTPGWATDISVVFPLDPPRTNRANAAVAELRPREVQVVDFLLAGYRNRAIAEALGISENTVKFHVSRILSTLGAASRSEAIAMLLVEN